MRTIKRLLPIVAIMLISALTACNDDNNEPQEPRAEIQLTQEQRMLAEDGNEFAVDAFKAANDPKENALIAPYSTQLSLAMLANGAKGETFDEIMNAMHFAGKASISEINEFYKTVTSGLTGADSKVSLNTANALWVSSTISPMQNYIETLHSYYGATASNIDFSSPNALTKINKWASDATGGKISKLFNEIDPTASVCMVNTMAFDGKWAKRFETKATKSGEFTNWRGEKEQCMMMHGTMDAGVASTEEANMLELNYGNGSFVMDVIVPKDGRKINEYAASLTHKRISDLVSAITPSASIIVQMPKFEAKYSYNLIENLKSLGISKAFGDADFSGISRKQLAVTQCVQQLWVKVDESGTKVAAATGTVLGDITYIGGKFIVNSPFVYLIRERSTGVILAIGKVQTMAGMQ